MEHVLKIYIRWDCMHFRNIKQPECCAGSSFSVIFSPRHVIVNVIVKLLSWVCLASCTMKLKTFFFYFFFFSFSGLYSSREYLGGTISYKCCWIWMFYYFVFWQNYKKISPRWMPMFHLYEPIWHPDIPAMVWKVGKNQSSGDLSPENLAQYVVQSGSLLYTKFSHSFPSNLKHIRNWLHGLLENVVWINTFLIWFVWLYIARIVII